jgi:hypothetical protein
MIQRHRVKEIYERLQKAALNHKKLHAEFATACTEYYGYELSEVDELMDDEDLVDTLNYGSSTPVTFDDFDQRMKNKESGFGK